MLGKKDFLHTVPGVLALAMSISTVLNVFREVYFDFVAQWPQAPTSSNKIHFFVTTSSVTTNKNIFGVEHFFGFVAQWPQAPASSKQICFLTHTDTQSCFLDTK